VGGTVAADAFASHPPSSRSEEGPPMEPASAAAAADRSTAITRSRGHRRVGVKSGAADLPKCGPHRGTGAATRHTPADPYPCHTEAV